MFKFYKSIENIETYYIVGKTDDIKKLVGSWRRSNGSGKSYIYGNGTPVFSHHNWSIVIVIHRRWYRLIDEDFFLDLLTMGEVIKCEKSSYPYIH